MEACERAIVERLPRKFQKHLEIFGFEHLEEIRFRVGRPLELCYGRMGIYRVDGVTQGDMDELLNYLTGYSVYAYEENIRNGFFTIEGGHRVGLVGHTSLDEVEGRGMYINHVTDISGINIRIAHPYYDCAKGLIPYIRCGVSIHNTILLAAPGVGKTTYLRDLIRLLSQGDDTHEGLKVSVVDERSEIAACYKGNLIYDLGPRTDVLDNCPKSKGMEILLRSMSPEVLAVDELGGEEDAYILSNMLYSGIRVLGTVHAGSVEDLTGKRWMKPLVERGMIQRYILMKKSKEGNRSFEVFDQNRAMVG